MPEPSDHAPLAGRAVLVTGASRGIGRTVAQHLGSLGADVAMLQRGPAEETCRALAELGRRTVVVRVDLADPARAEAAVGEAVGALGQLDACVCNAAVIERKPALEVDLVAWARVITINLVSTFSVARAAGAAMLGQGSGGSIVIVASVLARQGGLNVSSYAASKAGVANLARALANEWGPLGIRVNTVAPGYVANEQTRPLREDEARRTQIDARIPLGRWGREDDIASAVAFLVGDEAAYVTGHELVVDGGWLGR